MDILIGYGVGPRMDRILRNYWNHYPMVDRDGRYCGTPFKVQRGVAQGGTLSPPIFNMVVDT